MPAPILPILHYHPLSSYCHKALIAIDVLGAEVDKRLLNLGDAAERAAHLALWPLGKMPVLVDRGLTLPETSILIEHLQLHCAQPGRRLIPQDPDAALQVRLWDRLFDLYVMAPMQACTADLLKPDAARDPATVAQAHATLATAYALADGHLQGRSWLCGEVFSLADCAAAPALFYAVTYLPVPPQLSALQAYVDRLMEHPPVARTIDQARPWFRYYPGRAGLALRYFDPAA